MSALRLRPRFELSVALSADEVMARIMACAEQGSCSYRARFFEGQVELKIPRERRHTWSPKLNLLILAAPEGGALLKGRFGPMEGVWTMFMALYAISGLLALGALMLWSSALMLGATSTFAKILFLASSLAFVVTHVALRIGQSLGQAKSWGRMG
jgi:hypothetical protein